MNENVRLILDPNKFPISWNKFIRTYSPYSVAIDGYVKGEPKFQEKGPYANFNHHEKVVRQFTRATCAQIMVAIRLGLFEQFKDENGPKMDVYANHLDHDILLSSMLLKHSTIAEKAFISRLDKLVGIIDMLDTTAGAYPLPREVYYLEELAWIFEPYTRFRCEGRIDHNIVSEYEEVVEKVRTRIIAHIRGEGRAMPYDLSFKLDENYNGWAIVSKEGQQGRTGMFAKGIRKFISWRELPNGNLKIIVGKMTPYLSFDMIKFGRAANKLEGNKKESWGGSDMFQCSPRVSGTRCSLEDIKRLVSECER